MEEQHSPEDPGGENPRNLIVVPGHGQVNAPSECPMSVARTNFPEDGNESIRVVGSVLAVGPGTNQINVTSERGECEDGASVQGHQLYRGQGHAGYTGGHRQRVEPVPSGSVQSEPAMDASGLDTREIDAAIRGVGALDFHSTNEIQRTPITEISESSSTTTTALDEPWAHKLHRLLHDYVFSIEGINASPSHADSWVKELTHEIVEKYRLHPVTSAFEQDTIVAAVRCFSPSIHSTHDEFNDMRMKINDLFGSFWQFLEDFVDYVESSTPLPSLTATQTAEPKYELVETFSTDAKTISSSYAKTLSSKYGILYTLSPTGLFTIREFDPDSQEASETCTQLELPKPGNFPDIRFASPWAYHEEMVVAADKYLILYDSQRRQIWSKNTGQHILDVSADFTRNRVYVLTRTRIDIYSFENNNNTKLNCIETVIRLVPEVEDSGRIIVFGNSLYITREKQKLLMLMNLTTHEAKTVISDLVRPTALSANLRLLSLAVSHDHEIRIYSASTSSTPAHEYFTHDLTTRIHVGTAITDVAFDDERIYVLTGNEIKVFELSRR